MERSLNQNGVKLFALINAKENGQIVQEKRNVLQELRELKAMENMIVRLH